MKIAKGSTVITPLGKQLKNPFNLKAHKFPKQPMENFFGGSTFCLPTLKNTHTHTQLHPDFPQLTDLKPFRWGLLGPLAKMGLTSNIIFPKIHYPCHLPFPHSTSHPRATEKCAVATATVERPVDTSVPEGCLWFHRCIRPHPGEKSEQAQRESFFDLLSGN